MQVDHTDIARAVFDAEPPDGTVEGALRYVTRLLAALPAGELAGYELKPGGENIAPLADGSLVSVGRVMYPDGQLYKVMTDVPHGVAEWTDDGTVDVARYRAFASDAPLPPVPPDAPPPPATTGLSEQQYAFLMARLDGLSEQLDANTEKIQQQIDQAIKNAEATGKQIAGVVTPLLPALTDLFRSK